MRGQLILTDKEYSFLAYVSGYSRQEPFNGGVAAALKEKVMRRIRPYPLFRSDKGVVSTPEMKEVLADRPELDSLLIKGMLSKENGQIAETYLLNGEGLELFLLEWAIRDPNQIHGFYQKHKGDSLFDNLISKNLGNFLNKSLSSRVRDHNEKTQKWL